MNDVGMGRRPLLGMVLGWLAVVVAVAAITFVVVDRAGRGVGQASAAEVVAVLPSTSARPTSATPPPTPRPSSTSDEPEATPTPDEPEATPTRTSSDDGPDTASFSSDGGTVVASCDGSQISLVSIRPRDGWRFEKESEHGGLEVVFKSVEREVEIHVSCQGGVPTRGET